MKLIVFGDSFTGQIKDPYLDKELFKTVSFAYHYYNFNNSKFTEYHNFADPVQVTKRYYIRYTSI